MKKIIVFLGVIVFVAAFYGLGKQVLDSFKAGQRLDQEAEKLVLLQDKNKELKKRLEEVGSIQFIEQQARDKLNMLRANEVVMIIPDGEIDKVLAAQKEVIEERLSNWQGWLKLFWR